MFQIQSIFSENAYGPETNFAWTGTGPRSGGYRPLIYNNGFAELFEDAYRGKS